MTEFMHGKSNLRLWRVAVFASFLLSATACKEFQGNSSNAKTVGNLARPDAAKLTLNDCHADKPSDAKTASYVDHIVNDKLEPRNLPDSTKAAVRAALNGIPTSLLYFFVSAQGSIKISDNEPPLCANSLTPAEIEAVGEGAGTPTACYYADAGQPPVIYIGGGTMGGQPVTAELNVKHNLVRMFGYVYSKFVMLKINLRIADLQSAINTGSGPADNSGKKVQYTDAEIKDFRDSLQTYSTLSSNFVKYGRALSDAFFADLKLGKATAAYDRLKKFEAKGETAFDQTMVAEAFDSYYCSSDVRSHFANTKTAAAFEPIRAELEASGTSAQ